MEFIPDRDSLKVENPEETAKCTIRVDRNGWGYTALHVTTEGSFLEIEKETYGEDDFLARPDDAPVIQKMQLLFLRLFHERAL